MLETLHMELGALVVLSRPLRAADHKAPCGSMHLRLLRTPLVCSGKYVAAFCVMSCASCAYFQNAVHSLAKDTRSSRRTHAYEQTHGSVLACLRQQQQGSGGVLMVVVKSGPMPDLSPTFLQVKGRDGSDGV
jgi:hypothetical protein